MATPKGILSYQQLFDRFALGYYVVDLLSFGFAGRLRKEALNKIPLQKERTVVDLMCGTGNNVKYLLEKAGGNLHYTGIDVSGKMIDRAIHKYSCASGNIAFVKANVFYPIPGGEKSAHLLCSYGLKCIEVAHYNAFVEIINTALNKEGSLSMVEFQQPSHFFIRGLFKIYLHTVYKVGCFMATGSTFPAHALLRCISERIDLVLLKKLFQEKGFDIRIEEKWMRSVVFIYGKKVKQNF